MRYLLALILTAAQLLGASLCVGPTSSGSANGSDWNNKLQWSSVTFVRGNTYYLEDGTYAGRTLNTATSGTSAITIKKATASDHVTDTGWSSTMGDGQAVLGKLQIDTQWWVIDGQARSGIRSGYGFKVDGNTSPTTSPGIGLGSTGPTSAHNSTVRYCELAGSNEDGTTVDTYQDANVLAYYSTNLTIAYCWLWGSGQKPLTFISSDSIAVDHCVIEKNDSTPANHGEGVQLGLCGNITFSFNLFSDLEGTTYIGTPWGTHNSLTNITIYGNVFERPSSPTRSGIGHGPISIWDATLVGWLRIYNNTFINFSTGSINLVGDGAHSTDVANLDYRNNLWLDSQNISATGCIASLGSVTGTFNWSHQGYWNCSSVTDSGNNAQTFGSDPLPNWETGTYSITAATTAGYTLSSPYDTDPTGATRGADGTWDRGAYEYASGGSDTTPPNISSISASPSTTSATVTWTTDEAATSGLQWGLTASYGSSSTNSSTVTSHSLSATSLSSGTTYHYRVLSTDAAGNTATGNDGTFTTAAEGSTVGSKIRGGTIRGGTIR